MGGPTQGGGGGSLVEGGKAARLGFSEAGPRFLHLARGFHFFCNFFLFGAILGFYLFLRFNLGGPSRSDQVRPAKIGHLQSWALFWSFAPGPQKKPFGGRGPMVGRAVIFYFYFLLPLLINCRIFSLGPNFSFFSFESFLPYLGAGLWGFFFTNLGERQYLGLTVVNRFLIRPVYFFFKKTGHPKKGARPKVNKS